MSKQEVVIIAMEGYHGFEIGDIAQLIGDSTWFKGMYEIRGWSEEVTRMITQNLRPSEVAFMMPYTP